MAKILLTTPPWLHFHTLQVLFPNLPSLGLQIIAGILKKEGHDVLIKDVQHLPPRDKTLLKAIETFQPDIIGVSVSEIATTPIVIEIVTKLKKKYPEIKFIVGGQAPTYRPDLFLGEGKPFEVAVLYEAEATILSIVETLLSGGNLENVPGMARFDGKEIKFSKEKHVAFDFNAVPSPYLEGSLHKALFFNGFNAVMESSRGCPFQCTFCPIPDYYGNPPRYKSSERIIEEMKELKSKGVGEIAFIDDSFGIKPDIIKQVFERMIKEKINMPFGVQIRADVINANPDLIELGAKAGMFMAVIGFEGYSSSAHANLKKGNSQEINQNASRILRRSGVFVYGTHIFGYPGSTWKDNFKTFFYGRKNSDIFRMTIFTPVPGSKIYNEFCDSCNIGSRKPEDFYEGKYLVPNAFNPFLAEFVYFGLTALHYALPDTMFKALFHSNHVFRIFHRRAYKGAFLFVCGQIAAFFNRRKIGV